ncbi:MAG: bi-domain-containing oxidoreductase [Anaerolineales bacterium]|nr:bi-domain-containing oxidoreductase [Anaerolineales bacterium]
MKQVFFNGKGELILKDVPIPICGSGSLLVRTEYSLISAGTESTLLAGAGSLVKQALRRPDLVGRVVQLVADKGLKTAAGVVRGAVENWYPLGYSAAGSVIAVGEGVDGFSVGDEVACAGAGFANHASVISVPKNLVVKLPEGLSCREGCFATVGAIALQGVRRAEPMIGETVVVIGAGLVGILTAQILQANGCKAICVDVASERLDIVSSLGIRHTLRSGFDDLVRSVRDLTGGHGADAIIVTAGTESSEPVNQGFEMCRERGRVVIVGSVGMELERDQYYRKEIDLRISRSYGPGRYDSEYEQKGMSYPLGYVRWTETRNLAAFLDLVTEDNVLLAPLISAEFDIEHALQAYAAVTSGDREILAVLFSYSGDVIPLEAQTVWRHPRQLPAKKGRIGLAMVGAGHFARAVHMPNLKYLSSKVSVRAVVSGSGGSARQAAEQLGAPLAATDLSSVLQDEGLDAVLIATRHHLHAEQCIAAVRAGKHVFVEKPLALTVDQCQEIMLEVEKAGVLCAVGFNRRFSSLALSMRDTLDHTNGPKHIVCRVNAGPLPHKHWLSDPEIGGGRLLGEGCHFFDFMAWLTDSTPVSVSAQMVGDLTDEIVAIVKYANGSVGTLIYTGMGNADFPKERIEVFAGGGVAILDDFRSLVFSGMPGKSLKLRSQVKGHRSLLAHFVGAVCGETELRVTAEDGLAATLCARAALRSVSEGQIVSVA